MGLFSSSSRSTTQTTYDTETNTNQVDQSGNAGLNLSQIGGGVDFSSHDVTQVDAADNSQRTTITNINTSDQGTIGAARDLGLGALGVANVLSNAAFGASGQQAKVATDLADSVSGRAFGLASDSLHLAGAGIDNALAANGNALAFGRTALESVAGLNSQSVDLLANLVSGALDNSKTLTRDALDAGAAQVKQAVQGFSTLAQQNSQTSDDRITKVVGYALAAVAAALILPAIFKGSRA